MADSDDEVQLVRIIEGPGAAQQPQQSRPQPAGVMNAVPVVSLLGTQDGQPSKENTDANKAAAVAETGKRKREEDEAAVCTICLEPFTSEGPHRPTTTPCGHIYGKECILAWLNSKPAKDQTCPQCKKKVKKNQLVDLYNLPTVIAGAGSLPEASRGTSSSGSDQRAVAELAAMRAAMIKMAAQLHDAEVKKELLQQEMLILQTQHLLGSQVAAAAAALMPPAPMLPMLPMAAAAPPPIQPQVFPWQLGALPGQQPWDLPQQQVPPAWGQWQLPADHGVVPVPPPSGAAAQHAAAVAQHQAAAGQAVLPVIDVQLPSGGYAQQLQQPAARQRPAPAVAGAAPVQPAVQRQQQQLQQPPARQPRPTIQQQAVVHGNRAHQQQQQQQQAVVQPTAAAAQPQAAQPPPAPQPPQPARGSGSLGLSIDALLAVQLAAYEDDFDDMFAAPVETRRGVHAASTTQQPPSTRDTAAPQPTQPTQLTQPTRNPYQPNPLNQHTMQLQQPTQVRQGPQPELQATARAARPVPQLRGKLLHRYFPKQARCLALQPQGGVMLFNSTDGNSSCHNIFRYCVNEFVSSQVHTLPASVRQITDIKAHPDVAVERRLIATSDAGLWIMSEGDYTGAVRVAPDAKVTACAWSDDSPHQVYLGTKDARVMLYDIRQPGHALSTRDLADSYPVHSLVHVGSRHLPSLRGESEVLAATAENLWRLEVRDSVCTTTTSFKRPNRTCEALLCAPSSAPAGGAAGPMGGHSVVVSWRHHAPNVTVRGGHAPVAGSHSVFGVAAWQERATLTGHSIGEHNSRGALLPAQPAPAQPAVPDSTWERTPGVLLDAGRAYMVHGDSASCRPWVWDMETGNVVAGLKQHPSPVLQVAAGYLPSLHGKGPMRVVAVCSAMKVELWQV